MYIKNIIDNLKINNPKHNILKVTIFSSSLETLIEINREREKTLFKIDSPILIEFIFGSLFSIKNPRFITGISNTYSCRKLKYF